MDKVHLWDKQEDGVSNHIIKKLKNGFDAYNREPKNYVGTLKNKLFKTFDEGFCTQLIK